MAYDDTEISNMAIGHLGIGVSIGDIATENSPEANACNRYLDTCKQSVLEMKPWGFATVRWTLAELTFPSTNTFYDHWGKRYKFPTDCSRADIIVNPAHRTPPTQSDKIPFKVIKDTDGSGGKAILCDIADAVLEGNELTPSTADFSATYALGVSLKLAMMISRQLRVNAKLTQVVRQDYQMWMMEVMDQDFEQGTTDPMPISAYQSARG